MRRWQGWLLAGGLLLAALVSFLSFAHFVCNPAIDRSLEDAPRAQAYYIAQAVNQYHVIHEKYPDRLEDLTIPDSEGEAYLRPEEILDPWGKPYQAEFPKDNEGRVRIWTTTPSGETVSNERKH